MRADDDVGMPIRTLLIANRGEIAVRIADAANALNISSIAVYSPDDEASLHIQRCDSAVRLPGNGVKAYLDVAAIVQAALDHGCDAVHPGYGFLSENPDFADACAQAGLIFVGPSAEVLRLFGHKSRARQVALECGVPVVPAEAAPITLAQAEGFFAAQGGQAVVLKAVAGGGGRGMRIVRAVDDLEQAYNSCRSEAQKAFGEDALQVEVLLDSVRHIEVQILADHSGSVVHVGERDCSLQRRNQKIIELAPCPDLPPAVRQRLLDAAVNIARHAGYTNAGTFEFLVETWSPEIQDQDPAFYFLEANPRIQVEHTITEEAYGIDLVQAQLHIAAGAKLQAIGLTQDKLNPSALSMQMRINLERPGPDGRVIPSIGTIERYTWPSGAGIRLDSGGYIGYPLPAGYDSLIAKLIVSVPADDLTALRRKAIRALKQLELTGVEHNGRFLQVLLEHPELTLGNLYTRFVDDRWDELRAATASDTSASPNPVNDDGMATVTSELQGTVVEVAVTEGAPVLAGQTLLVLDAMKMEYPITSPCAGTVTSVYVLADDLVTLDQPLVSIETAVEPAEQTIEDQTADPDAMPPALTKLLERREWLHDHARPDAVARRHANGQRTARENIEDLFDTDSFSEYGGLAVAAQRSRRSEEDLIRNTPADGIITGVGSVNGEQFDGSRSRCAVLAYDYTVLAGTQGTVNHHKTDRMLEVAQRAGLPVVLFSEGGGGRPGDVDANGVAGLDITTFRRFAELSGSVPLVGINSGRCFAGNAALLGCCDVIIATRNSSIGMGGPAMIEGGGLGKVQADEVGPVSMQEPNGVIDLVVDDEAAAVAVAKRYLSYFQGKTDQAQAADQRLLRSLLPENRLRVYDVRQIVKTLVDRDSVLELRAGFGHGIITSLARLAGQPIGVLANNPKHLSGAIDGPAADKAARFMQLCDAFGLPLISLCDTPGFMVGPDSEKTATVRRFARLFVTAGGMTAPILTVVLRKAYGLGAMAMAGGTFAATELSVSWPAGEFGGMGLEGAIKLGLRKELEAIEDDDKREAFYQRAVAGAYHHGRAENAAAHVEIDDVIDPAETRTRLLLTLDNVNLDPGFPRKKRNHIDTW